MFSSFINSYWFPPPPYSYNQDNLHLRGFILFPLICLEITISEAGMLGKHTLPPLCRNEGLLQQLLALVMLPAWRLEGLHWAGGIKLDGRLNFQAVRSRTALKHCADWDLQQGWEPECGGNAFCRSLVPPCCSVLHSHMRSSQIRGRPCPVS